MRDNLQERTPKNNLTITLWALPPATWLKGDPKSANPSGWRPEAGSGSNSQR